MFNIACFCSTVSVKCFTLCRKEFSIFFPIVRKQSQFRGKPLPTYVYPECIKEVIRSLLEENVRDYHDPRGSAVSFTCCHCFGPKTANINSFECSSALFQTKNCCATDEEYRVSQPHSLIMHTFQVGLSLHSAMVSTNKHLEATNAAHNHIYWLSGAEITLTEEFRPWCPNLQNII